jgi:predicted RNA-binding Zn-ribbon protein involved in translation (DUF1610 family)
MADKNPQRQKTATELVCPNCGMTRDEWGSAEGYKQEGQTYCCEGCADGTGCSC